MRSASIRRFVPWIRGLCSGLLLLTFFAFNANAQQSTLIANQWLMPGDHMSSPNGLFQLWMQHDGNLVLYDTRDGRALWHTNTFMYPGLRAVMQSDGNLVLYDGWVEYGYYYAYWHANTWQYPGSTLTLQDDGNLVIYAPGGYVPWHTNTPQNVGGPGQPPISWPNCTTRYWGCTSCNYAGNVTVYDYELQRNVDQFVSGSSQVCEYFGSSSPWPNGIYIQIGISSLYCSPVGTLPYQETVCN